MMADPRSGGAEEAKEISPVDHSGARTLVGYQSSMPDDGRGECGLDVEPRHLNRMGVLHGGFISMLLDNGCGVAVRNMMGGPDIAVVTVTLAVNFMASVRSGRVTATGRVTGGGRSLKFAEAELRDESGQLLATATATFKIVRK